MNDPELLPVRLYVSADQVLVEGDVARVSMSFETAEDFSRKFLRALSPVSDEGEGGEG